jgi:hypothetical protein
MAVPKHLEEGRAMSIDKSDAVDGLGVSRVDGKIVLIIADHLAWREQHG